jgi:predicted flap endonuclease-1-like 5' DNA nuclease
MTNITKYSYEECKKAGIPVKKLCFNKVKLDSRRNSCCDENVEALKKLELKDQPKKVRKVKENKPKKEKTAAAPKVEKKEQVKTAAKSSKVSKLEDLEGIDAKIVQKLKDFGIDSPAKLTTEDIKEVSKVTKVTQKQLKAWIDQINA